MNLRNEDASFENNQAVEPVDLKLAVVGAENVIDAIPNEKGKKLCASIIL